MPKRKAAEHQHDQDFVFTSNGTKATSDVWYAVLARQPDSKFWLSACEQIAYKLGEQWVSVGAIRGADEATINAVIDAAFKGIKAPKLGLQIMLKRVLEQLRKGVLRKQKYYRLRSAVVIVSCRSLTARLPVAGVANADHSMDRRHGEGQEIANIAFREFQADMEGKYGDAALQGLERFIRNHCCEAVRAQSKIKAYGSQAGMMDC